MTRLIAIIQERGPLGFAADFAITLTLFLTAGVWLSILGE